MLHVTNGDAAAYGIRDADVPGDVLPWRDVLHEGPVPADLPPSTLSAVRAAFIGGQAWAPLEDVLEDFAVRDELLRAKAGGEVCLWFEHDLYDQLQLIQVLSLLGDGDGGTHTAVLPAEYLGPATPDRLAALYAERVPVSREMRETAAAAWEAFRAPDPRGLEALAAAGTPALPHLAPALVRHLEQFPGTGDGLSRSERQALAALAAGPATAGQLFAAHQAAEDPIWLGDLTFAGYLADLAACGLVRREDGGAFALPALDGDGDGGGGAMRAVMETRLALTDPGRAVLEGRADRVARCGIERWLGGVRLRGGEAAYRWDAAARRIVAAP